MPNFDKIVKSRFKKATNHRPHPTHIVRIFFKHVRMKIITVMSKKV